MNSQCVELYPKNSSLLVSSKIANQDLAEIVNYSLTEAVFRFTSDGSIVYLNNAFVALFEIDKIEEVIGKKAGILYAKKSNADIINKSLKANSLFEDEIELRKFSGDVFSGYLSARLVRKGKEEFIDGVIRDISEEKKSRQEIEKRTRIQNLLIKISSKFLDTDPDDTVQNINESIKEVGTFLGADRLQVHEYDLDNCKRVITYEWVTDDVQASIDTHSEFSLDLIQDMVELHEKGEHLFIPTISRLPDSASKDILMSQNVKSSLTIPMKLEGRCVGFLSLDSIHSFSIQYSESVISMLKLFANMLAGFSVRAKGHVRLRELMEKVTAQGKQHKDFSFITSHNIRASAANLVAITNLMNKDYSERYLRMLDVTVRKLNESICNVNSILQLDYKDLLKWSVCNVGEAVKRILESLKVVISDHELSIDNQVSASILLNTIPSYFDNILYQIISNAIKFGTNDSSKRITIRAERHSRKVEVKIIDYGDGFDIAKHKHQMFKVGSRFDRSISDGQGLGLYIAKQQVNSLDGEIEVDSSERSGTIVSLSFPIK
ncbi:MAG: ATP-binding protein [Ekhidna sp.]